jgi:hypothetical protein
VIALWTQLGTFEEGVPKAFAWLAWAALLVSIGILAVRITPRRLSDFWRHLDLSTAAATQALDEGEEEKIIDELSNAFRSQRDGLQRAVRTSVLIGLTALDSLPLRTPST